MILSFGGLAYTFNLPYGVAKGTIDQMAKDMAIELEDQVCVTSFWPGLVDTEHTQQSTVASGDWDKYVKLPMDNAESPQFLGRAIVAVATNPNNMVKTGTYQVVAELSEEYGLVKITGTAPPSIHSLWFLLPTYGMTKEQQESVDPSLVPNWKLPFWIMAQGKPPDQAE
jgi:dehydrogenase/reductase SDR family protein 1